MTDEQLRELERLAADAAPGPWCAGVHTVSVAGPDGKPAPRTGMRAAGDTFPHVANARRGEDAELIAASREALPALITEVRRLRDERDAARAWRRHDNGQLGTVMEEKSARIRERNEAREERDQWKARAELAEHERDIADKYLAKARSRLAEVERERDTLAEGCERLAAQAAVMRAWIDECSDTCEQPCSNCDDFDPCDWHATRRRALAPDAGKGWVSPEKHAEVAAQCAVMRGLIAANRLVLGEYSGPREVARVEGGDAGRALLAEVEALREVAEKARALAEDMTRVKINPSAPWGIRHAAIVSALARLASLKAGGR